MRTAGDDGFSTRADSRPRGKGGVRTGKTMRRRAAWTEVDFHAAPGRCTSDGDDDDGGGGAQVPDTATGWYTIHNGRAVAEQKRGARERRSRGPRGTPTHTVYKTDPSYQSSYGVFTGLPDHRQDRRKALVGEQIESRSNVDKKLYYVSNRNRSAPK